MAIERDERT